MEPDAPAPEPGPQPTARRPLAARPEAEAPPPPLTAPPPSPVVRRGLVPQALLDPDAVFVVRRLQKNGHEAYLVGGCVRDLLAGLEPKDFDVATDAHPSRIKRLFHSARIIGRRFRLVHVRFPGDHVIETATFRGDPGRLAEEAEEAGAPPDDRADRFGAENVFGTAVEDAWRRDFTINALFYDPVSDEVIDWVGGLADLDGRLVRSIGEPGGRIAEDPVRMIRAVHFAERLEFDLEPDLEQAIGRQASMIAEASPARLYIELLKIVGRGRARPTLHRLFDLGVLRGWIPELARYLDQPMAWPSQAGGTHVEASRGEPADLPAAHATWNLLGAADRYGLAAHGAPESLALAVLFGPFVLETWHRSGKDGYPAFHDHVEQVFRPVALRMSVPRWAQARMRDVLWMLLELRAGPQGGRRRRIYFRPGFAEALTLLGMDLAARDCPDGLLEEWRAAAEDLGVETGLAPTDVARQEALDAMPPDVRRRGRRGGRGAGRRRGEGRGPQGRSDGPEPSRPFVPPLPEEADAWDAPPPPAIPYTPPSVLTPPPPPPPVPPPPPRAVPRPLLGDDDFAAGLA